MVFNTETAVSLLRLLVGFVSGVATVVGWSFDADLWFNIGLSILTIIIMVYLVWWKNQPITEAAQEAQIALEYVKAKDGDAVIMVVEDEDSDDDGTEEE